MCLALLSPSPPSEGGEGRGEEAHAFLNARQPEGLRVISRRSVLKAGLTGLAGLSFPQLLRLRAATSPTAPSVPRDKAVILLWM